MNYKFVNGWKFPEYESRLCAIDENSESVYTGLSHINKALEYVKKFDVMVDVGANVGLISVPMSKKFNKVIAFECVPDTFECLSYNLQTFTNNTEAHNFAVSNAAGTVDVAIPKQSGTMVSSGWASISKERQDAFNEKDYIQVQSITIDELNLDCLDFLKIDVEQAEMMVIQGALETIQKFKPVIEFENKRRENQKVIELLNTIDYSIIPGRKAKSSEAIMIPSK